MQLTEKYRPQSFADVAGQDKAIEYINSLRKNGLNSRAYWISGQSGTGKTTLARLIASEVSTPFATEELDGADVDKAFIEQCERQCRYKPMGAQGWCYLVNEAHGIRGKLIKSMNSLLEQPHVLRNSTWIFTTTTDGQIMFDDLEDAGPFSSRCTIISLARRDICKPFAERLVWVAQQEGIELTVETAIKVLRSNGTNLRAGLQTIETM